jgi:hypothetical protein
MPSPPMAGIWNGFDTARNISTDTGTATASPDGGQFALSVGAGYDRPWAR